MDETRLPGYGLKFTSSISAGTRDTRTITVTATNGDVGPAYTTQINGLSLHQISGPRCSPQITAPGSYPIALGDLPVSGTASATFTLSLAGCNPNAQWILTAPWTSATYETGTFFQVVDFHRGKDRD